jgi:hypothetical protein
MTTTATSRPQGQLPSFTTPDPGWILLDNPQQIDVGERLNREGVKEQFEAYRKESMATEALIFGLYLPS